MGDSSTMNGDMPSSQFFDKNPIGAKSLAVTDSVYVKFAKPFFPYLQTPYSIVAPYLAKADELGDASLNKIDNNFPVVKTKTEDVKSTVFDVAFFPLRVAGDSKDYVFKTYDHEYKKCGGNGVVAGGKAMITTGLVASSDALSYLSQLFAAKKEEAKGAFDQAKDVINEKANN